MKTWKRLLTLALAGALTLGLTACVDQHPDPTPAPVPETTDAPEAGSTGAPETQEPERRIIATSYATIQICDKLGLDLIATCDTSGDLPERYRDLPTTGTAMAPDAEQIALLDPTDVIGPDTLIETIKPTYDAANIPATFIDLQSVEGMYESIAMLGEKFGVEEAAQKLIDEYEATMADFMASIEGKERPRVLVLMGLPGAYIECTPNSYVGSLVELAGAESVVQVDDNMNFVSWNTEELLELDPDIILLTAHGLPDLAMEFFAKEFTTNDIWKHFRAVQEGHVYQLDYDLFNMSCTFDWPQALETLRVLLYENGGEEFAPAADLKDAG